jgi:hypothetical protein
MPGLRRHRPIFDTKKQVWNCRGCQQGGDVIALACHLDRLGFREAVEQLAGRLAQPPKLSADEPRISKPATPVRRLITAIANPRYASGARRSTHAGPWSKPTSKAGGSTCHTNPPFEAIRYQPRLFFRGKTFPAMIALYAVSRGTLRKRSTSPHWSIRPKGKNARGSPMAR